MRLGRVVRDLLLDQRLYVGIGDVGRRIRAQDDRAHTRSVADRLARNAVLAQLVEQRAGQDEVEKLVDLLHESGLGPPPGSPPEEEEDLCRLQERPAAIRELRRGDGRGERITVQRNDLDWVGSCHFTAPPSPESYESRAASVRCSPPVNIPRPSRGRLKSGSGCRGRLQSPRPESGPGFGPSERSLAYAPGVWAQPSGSPPPGCSACLRW